MVCFEEIAYLTYDHVNLLMVKKEFFLINAQSTNISRVAQGFGSFKDVSIQRVSILGRFDPSTSLIFCCIFYYLQIEYLVYK